MAAETHGARSKSDWQATRPGTLHQRLAEEPLLPGRVDGLSDQVRRVRAGPRPELLEAPGVDLCDVKVAFLVSAHTVHAPERAGEISHGSPRIEQTAVEVVLEHLMGVAIEGRHGPIRADLDEVEARRTDGDCPLGKVSAIFVEDLDAVVVAIVDEHTPRLEVDGDAVH